jgi:hypothetical protein
MKLDMDDSVGAVMPGGVLMRSRKRIDANQAWFWTPGWQRAEREASEDIRRGRAQTYKTERGFLRQFAK